MIRIGLFIAIAALAQAAGLQGLYLQLQSVGAGVQHFHYYFWPDGKLCAGLPLGGLDQEPAIYAATSGAIGPGGKCGTYKISSGQMTVTWPDGAQKLRLANLHDRDFELQGYSTTKVAPFTAGTLMSGTFTSTVVGDLIRKQTYVFRKDGTYEFNDVPVVGQAPTVAHSGTYRFFGNTLELTGTGGKIRHTAYPWATGGFMNDGSVFAPR